MTTITTLPDAPSRTDPSTFSSKSDALLGALATFVTETNTVAGEVNANAATATTQATNAANSATAAAGSVLAAGAVAWVSGTTYAIGDCRYSLIDYQTYRRTTSGAGTTDPSADGTNWTKAVSITGANTFTAAQIYSDYPHSRAMLIDCGLVVVDKGNSSTTTQTYDYTAGSVQTSTATGDHTIATSNWPPTGNLGQILIQLTNGGAYTITMPTISWLKSNGTTTTSFSTYISSLLDRTALQSSGMDQILLWSRDAGTTIFGKLI